MKKTNVAVLSAVCILSLVGCKTGGNNGLKEFVSNADALGYTVAEMQEAVLGEYDALYKAAAKITDPTKTGERYEAFAKAEYNLIYESALMVPWLAQNGTSASVSKTVPWQAGRASYGLTSDKYKNVVATNAAITKEQRNAVTAIYEAGKGRDVSHSAGEDGWISLANENANGAISDGVYTVSGEGQQVSFTTKSELKTTYTKEPDNAFLNYLTNTWTYNSYHYCNMVDGLVENDKYGNIVGALADKYKVENTDDGKQVWTFHIRDGAKWVKNSDGSEVAPVKADDFVAAAEYVLDPKNAAGAVSLLVSFIDGAAAYFADKSAGRDFSKVGVKALNDNEIQYTLIEETPYFITALTYSPYLPVNRAFLLAEGSNFGKSEDHLLVNGAFRITQHVNESKMVYTKNTAYYDAAHVYLDTVTRQFIAGTKTSADVRQMYENGEIDAFTVNAKDTEGWNRYVVGEDAENPGTQKNPADPACNAITSYGSTTFFGYFNYNRSFWEVNDNKNAKDYDAKMLTAKAIMNKNFRLGFLYGLDVVELLKLYSPAYPTDWLMRGYTNRELVSYGGKDYADYVDDVFNEKQGTQGVSLTGILNGSDPIYNPEKAKAYFASAKAELLAAGIAEEQLPIKIDVIGDMDVESLAFQEAMFRTIEENSEGLIDIQINIPNSEDQDTGWGSIDCNYDFSMWSGWGPDYADPNTFLHTLCIDGDMVEYYGFAEAAE